MAVGLPNTNSSCLGQSKHNSQENSKHHHNQVTTILKQMQVKQYKAKENVATINFRSYLISSTFFWPVTQKYDNSSITSFLQKKINK